MGALAWIFGALGGLCAVMGIITALAVVPEVAALTWMFWFVLSGILLLTCIAFTVGRSVSEQLSLSAALIVKVVMSGSRAKISLRVYPSAAKSEVVGFTDGVLQVRVAAPPVKGKANKELIAFLSKALAVGKGALTIVKGQTSRSKVIAIDGLSQEDIMKQLSPKPFSSSDNASR